MKALAYRDKVLVREIDTTDVKHGEIHIIRNEAQLMVSGRVVDVGPNADRLDIQVGDRVWFKRECGVETEYGLLALRYRQIDCVGEGELVSLKHWYA